MLVRHTILIVVVIAAFASFGFSNSNPTSGCQIEESSNTDSDEIDKSQASHREMLSLLKQIKEQTSDSNPYLGSKNVRKLEQQLAFAAKNGKKVREWFFCRKLGEAELRLGNERDAIEYLTRALEMIDEINGKAGANGKVGALGMIENNFQLGVAYLRLGESQNCCRRHTPESCILPITGQGIHTDKEGSTKAIEYFTKVLEIARTPNRRTREARWLLNLAFMTLGEYPEGVPAKYRISADAFESKIEFPRFINIAPYLGMESFDLSGGAIVEDFDGDNYLDIFCSSWDTSGQTRLFRNDRKGQFVEITKSAGLRGIIGGLNMVQADYDNDGDVDVLILRGAWLQAAGKHPNSLLRNNGDGTFTDISILAGLAKANFPTQTASWADYDNDGDLDLYIGNETTSKFKAPCQLFRNEGNNTFVDVAEEAGVANDRFTKAVVWGDYDSDRFPDIYVSNMNQRNRLYRNNKDGTFTDVAEALDVALPVNSFPAWFFDYDNDGNPDIFASSYDGRTESVAEFFFDRKSNAESARLYHADGNGGFKDVALEAGLKQPMLPMGSNFGDLDGDGFLDFYLGTGDPDYSSLVPNLMFLNRNGTKFEDVSMAGGFAHLQKGHGVAFADLDNDGDLDVFEQMGGAFPGDKYPNALYENPGFGNNWICIKLVGSESNHSAIGARIHIVVENDDATTRSIFRHVNSGGSFGANPLRQTIGLGNAERISKIEVFWPTTGQTQTFSDVAANQFIQVIENHGQLTKLDIKSIRIRKSN